MKLKNILSILCVFFVAISCSMEDDFTGENSGQFTKDTYLSVKVKTAGVTTKAGESHPDGTAEYGTVDNCYYFVLDGSGQVLNSRYMTGADASAANILVKMKNATSVLAVVNCDDLKTQLESKADKAGILSVASTDATKMVKVGESNINWEGVTGSSSTAQTPESTVNVSITVDQKTSLVSFDGFYVKYKDNIYETQVRLTKITLSNLKSSVALNGTEGTIKTGEETILSNGAIIPVALKNDATIYNYKDESSKLVVENGPEDGSVIENLLANVFPNETGNDHLTMNITFTVNGKADTRSYTINPNRDTNTSGHDYVRAGYWYKMNLILNVTAAGIESLDVVPWSDEILIGGNNGVEFK